MILFLRKKKENYPSISLKEFKFVERENMLKRYIHVELEISSNNFDDE